MERILSGKSNEKKRVWKWDEWKSSEINAFIGLGVE